MPAKKNKRAGNKPNRFKIGDSVKVKKGVMCPDDDTVCMSGWQGRVFDVNNDVIGIHWDSITLRQLPVDYITKSEEEGLGWTEMYLGPDEIKPAARGRGLKLGHRHHAGCWRKGIKSRMTFTAACVFRSLTCFCTGSVYAEGGTVRSAMIFPYGSYFNPKSLKAEKRILFSGDRGVCLDESVGRRGPNQQMPRG